MGSEVKGCGRFQCSLIFGNLLSGPHHASSLTISICCFNFLIYAGDVHLISINMHLTPDMFLLSHKEIHMNPFLRLAAAN